MKGIIDLAADKLGLIFLSMIPYPAKPDSKLKDLGLGSVYTCLMGIPCKVSEWPTTDNQCIVHKH